MKAINSVCNKTRITYIGAKIGKMIRFAFNLLKVVGDGEVINVQSTNLVIKLYDLSILVIMKISLSLFQTS